MRKRALRIISGLGGTVALIMALPALAGAQEATPGEDAAAAVQAVLDNVWVFIAGCLVFFMQAGFALLEAGMTRAKNAVNIFAKNLSDAMIGVLAFFAVGFAFAFGGGGSFIGSEMFFLSGTDLTIGAEGGLSVATTFFFQVVFAATAVTIASGAMAERTKFMSYLIMSAAMTGFIYPVVVHWTWGGGMIAGWTIGDAVYSDFAGSGVVHMSGGILGLVGTLFLGPRLGKFGADGRPRAIPGHNIPFVAVGTLILWLGWFGFNPGSELAADSAVMTVAVNTMLAAAAGGVATTILIWAWKGKPDVAMICNGILAGLVAITAPCGAVNAGMSVVIGLIAGLLVVCSVLFLDRIHIDDPVGAVSVHGVCGLWGVLSIGLFARYDDAFLGREDAGLFYGGGIDQLAMQAALAGMIIVWVGGTATILFAILKATIGLRVSRAEEVEGLDELEHGLRAYPADVSFT